MDKPREIDFNNREVIVKIIGQDHIEVGEADLDGEVIKKGDKSRFVPFRLIINLKVKDSRNPTKESITFDTPIELRVRYKTSDQEAADAVRRELSLGYYDRSKWIRFTKRKHSFRKEIDKDPQNGGLLIATISEWVDPPIAIGT